MPAWMVSAAKREKLNWNNWNPFKLLLKLVLNKEKIEIAKNRHIFQWMEMSDDLLFAVTFELCSFECGTQWRLNVVQSCTCMVRRREEKWEIQARISFCLNTRDHGGNEIVKNQWSAESCAGKLCVIFEARSRFIQFFLFPFKCLKYFRVCSHKQTVDNVILSSINWKTWTFV